MNRKHSMMSMRGRGGSTRVYMRGKGMGSVLLGGSGSASALVNGPSVGMGLGAGFKGMGFLEQTALKSEGVMGLRKKLGNIRF
jgi:hypothetical protein